MRPFVLPAIAAVFPAALLALPPIHQNSVPVEEVIAWPTQLGPGSFGRTEVGRFTPHHGQSAVLEWGSQLALAYAPRIHELVESIASDVSAFAVLPGSTPTDLDRIVIATSSGLSLLHYDDSATPPIFVSTTIPETQGLAGAAAIACADLNGDALPDIAIVDSSQFSVAFYHDNGLGDFVPAPGFTQANVVRDVEALDWTASHPGSELALVTSFGVEVYSSSGARLWWRQSPVDDHVMTVVRWPDGSGGTDQLAVVQRTPGGSDQTVYLQGSTAGEPAFSITDLGVVGIDAGDWDGDGDEDLALSHQTSHQVRLLINQDGLGTGSTFSSDPVYVEDVDVGNSSLPAPNNQAQPCLTDLDDDGHGELVFGAQDPQWLAVRLGPVPAQSGSGCSALFLSYDIHVNGALTYPPVTASNRIGIELRLGNVWEYLSPELTHLEMVLWEQSHLTTSNVEVDPIEHVFFALDSGFRDPGGVGRIGFSLDDVATASGGIVEFLDKYFIELRPVTYIAGAVSNQRQTRVGGFTGLAGATPQGPNPIGHLHQNPGAATCEVQTLTYGVGPGENNNSSGGYVGGFVPQTRVPPIPGGALPTFPMDATSIMKGVGQ